MVARARGPGAGGVTGADVVMGTCPSLSVGHARELWATPASLGHTREAAEIPPKRGSLRASSAPDQAFPGAQSFREKQVTKTTL
jgi:hypothetical protein